MVRTEGPCKHIPTRTQPLSLYDFKQFITLVKYYLIITLNKKYLNQIGM